MKISCALAICLNFMTLYVLGQKKMIDVVACSNWERLVEINGKACLLSADGNFVVFKKYSENGGSKTVLKNLKSEVENKFAVTYNEQSFDGDRMFSFQIPGDSLVIFDTERERYNYISRVKMYFTIRSEGAHMLAYFKEQAGKRTLTIWNVKSGEKLEFGNVYMNKYWLNKQGTALLVEGGNGLIHTDLHNLKSVSIASDTSITDAALSYDGNEIVYMTNESNEYKLKYFDRRSAVGYVLLSDSSDYLKNKWKLEPGTLSFDNTNGNVFFKISRISGYHSSQLDSVITRDVDVWSYQDLYLQPRQLSMLGQKLAFITMINVQSKETIQLESDELMIEPIGNTSKYFVLTDRVNENEFYWNKQKKRMFLLSTITGERVLIKESQYPGIRFIGISPDNSFLVWFDGVDGNYYSYNIESGVTSNISKFPDGSLSTLNQRGESQRTIHREEPYEGQYWIDNSKSLIVNSKNDIWQLDPLALKRPINLTNRYGEMHDIRFRFVDSNELPIELNKNEFLVWAFDNKSKQNGFWKIGIGKSADPVKLIMSDNAYFFYPLSVIVSSNSAVDPTMFKPIKASKRNLFIVRRMSSVEAPNLYCTTNFESFKRITDINPNKEYVSISVKLIKWTLPDGQQGEGILHRPDNFDSTKKYPIIFNYYERRSECLNVYRTPELSGHNINIPWYVSRDYLIFEPDFYYKRGETAKSVINSIESAIGELRKLPYIDQNRMGIQGQSHGGYETNILATSTHFFAAACEMAGFTNIISEYGSIRPGGHNNQNSADRGQRNLGVFPWDHPEVFIENSPVFHVANMTTPLLMVHNKNDNAVLFSQAIELYMSMRRLGKEVWLLQYDGEGHEINENRNKLDYTIRMQQFFDHYLKDAPMPVWMSKGIPASLKGVVSGLRYETPSMGRK